MRRFVKWSWPPLPFVVDFVAIRRPNYPQPICGALTNVRLFLTASRFPMALPTPKSPGPVKESRAIDNGKQHSFRTDVLFAQDNVGFLKVQN